MSDIKNDFKNWCWTNDINRFTMMKTMLERSMTWKSDWGDKHRAHLRERMHDIQQKWPQFIKIDEIP